MPSRIDRYRMKDGVTPLAARYFNPVWQDIDLRLAELEQLRMGWQEAVRLVSDLGLARINEVIGGPLNTVNAAIEQVQQALADMPEVVVQGDLDAALQAEAAARAVLAQQITVINEALASLGAIDPFPNMTGAAGKWLGTDGETRFWGTPSVTSLGKGSAAAGQLLGINPAGNVVGLPNVVVVDSLAALRALEPAGDGQWALWKDTGLYLFQQAGTGIDDGELVIQPTAGGGRWLLQAVGWDMVAAMLAADLARLDELETAIAAVLDRLPAPRYRATATCSASSLASLATFDFTVTVPGAEVGDAVIVIPPGLLDARIVYSALVSASGIVTIRLSNPSASSATSNVGSGSWGVLVMK